MVVTRALNDIRPFILLQRKMKQFDKSDYGANTTTKYFYDFQTRGETLSGKYQKCVTLNETTSAGRKKGLLGDKTARLFLRARE